jgi:phosphoglycolate phosphatase-like HAD superfamily hydrolase
MKKKQKLLLFDIDGTLISMHGIPRKAMGRVLKRRYDDFEYDTDFNFSGRTDWEIVEHLLTHDNRTVDTDEVHTILDEFAVELEKEMENGKKPLIHPGVGTLLNELNMQEDLYLGLVTGNILKGARIKLSAAGLYHYFPVGGFGDDARLRRNLPAFAIKRAKEHYQFQLEKQDIWIIGDSIHDIDCAQANDLRCLAVCTGWTTRKELQNMDPEFLVDTFHDYRKIINLFLNE